MKRIVVTGGSGGVGRALRPLLAARHGHVVTLDVADPGPLLPNESFVRCDLGDLDGLTRAFAGAEGVVHLAGIPNEQSVDAIIDANVRGTAHVYEAARANGIGRVVFASSNHATGFYPRSTKVSVGMPLRPDTFYGLSKCWGELLAGLYWDKAGIRSLSIRIGNAFPRPDNRRSLAIWISARDLAQLVGIGLTHPEVDCQAVFGASRAENGWWDMGAAEALGYRPEDRIADFAGPEAEVEPPSDLPEISAHFQGGPFCTVDHDGTLRGRHDDPD